MLDTYGLNSWNKWNTTIR